MILIAGGSRDPNLTRLREEAGRSEIVTEALLFGHRWPAVSWDMARDELVADGRRLSPSAIFFRHDVFGSMADERPQVAAAALAWYGLLEGWTAAHPACRSLNANARARLNKPLALRVARDAGLAVPSTVVSSDVARIEEAAQRFALVGKPVVGGEYCRPMPEVLESRDADWLRATPLIVQERLEPPEVRIYRVGESVLPFVVEAPALDYRTSAECVVRPLGRDALAAHVVEGFGRLTEELGLDFAAADFKSCPRSGELLFLEVNTQPMFAAFDAASGGSVSRAILEHLTDTR